MVGEGLRGNIIYVTLADNFLKTSSKQVFRWAIVYVILHMLVRLGVKPVRSAYFLILSQHLLDQLSLQLGYEHLLLYLKYLIITGCLLRRFGYGTIALLNCDIRSPWWLLSFSLWCCSSLRRGLLSQLEKSLACKLDWGVLTLLARVDWILDDLLNYWDLLLLLDRCWHDHD